MEVTKEMEAFENFFALASNDISIDISIDSRRLKFFLVRRFRVKSVKSYGSLYFLFKSLI